MRIQPRTGSLAVRTIGASTSSPRRKPLTSSNPVRLGSRLSVTAALHTGMRSGELLVVRWSDVDFKNARIHLDASGTKEGRARELPMNETDPTSPAK